jgi:hypothetical protein
MRAARRALARSVEMNPDFFVTCYHLAWLYSRLGQYPAAIAMLTKGRLLSGDQRVKIAAADEVSQRKAVSAEGAQGFWRELRNQGSKDDPEIGELGMPQVIARMGDKQKALEGWIAALTQERVCAHS